MKRPSMLFLLVLLLLVGIVACGGETQVEEAAPEQAAATPTLAEPATLPPPVISEGEGDAVQTPTEEPVTEVEPPAEGGEETAAETETAVLEPWPADQFGYGVQIHGNATVGNPADTMQAVRDQLNKDWVKMQIQWWLIHPEPDADQWFFYDAVVDEAHAHGLRLLVSIVGAPAWTRAAGGENGPPDDYNEFAAFLDELLTRYEGKIDAVEVWNEQNLDREWATANGVNPEDYVRFLQLAYETIKARDPNIIVVSGALSPTGEGDWVRWADDFQWLDRALAAGMLDYADCVGAHHNGYNIPPDVPYEEAPNLPQAQSAIFRGPFDNPHHSWSFKTTLDTYAEKVQAIDPDMKLCVTEFGWASSEGYNQYPTGFEFAQDNTLEEQAQYIVQAFEQMRDSGDVWLAFLFNFDFGNKGSGPTDDPVPYSIIDLNGAPRPAFGAVAGIRESQ